MHRKGLVIGILILMLGVNIGSTFAGDADVKTMSSVGFDGNTLYVGGSGPGNYTSIQDALDEANNWDTIYVFKGKYLESIVIDKSINLIGEDRDITVIDGHWHDDFEVIRISADFVTIQGFTIKGSRKSGIVSISHNNTIKGNIIIDNGNGIQLGEDYEVYSHSNVIEENNIIWNHFVGISLVLSNNNVINKNIISSNKYHGIFLQSNDCNNNLITFNSISSHSNMGIWSFGNSNVIQRNTVFSNRDGIRITSCKYNIVQYNRISDNQDGIGIEYSYQTTVTENNINFNTRDAWIYGSFVMFFEGNWLKNNIFDSNYWGREQNRPKLILAWCIFIPFVIFDYNPTQEPYDI